MEHVIFSNQPLGVSQMALTLRFREPAGASPGPKFAGEFAFNVSAIGRWPMVVVGALTVSEHPSADQ